MCVWRPRSANNKHIAIFSKGKFKMLHKQFLNDALQTIPSLSNLLLYIKNRTTLWDCSVK